MMETPLSAAPNRTTISGLLTLLTSYTLCLIVRFGVTDVTTTLVYLVLINAFVLSSMMPPVLSSVCAYVISVAIWFVMHGRFTFRVNGSSLNQFPPFIVMSLAGLLVSWCAMALTVDVLHLPYLTGAIGTCVIVPALNFFVLRGWVFTTQARPPLLTGGQQ